MFGLLYRGRILKRIETLRPYFELTSGCVRSHDFADRNDKRKNRLFENNSKRVLTGSQNFRIISFLCCMCCF